MMKIKNFQHAKNLRFLSMKKTILITLVLILCSVVYATEHLIPLQGIAEDDNGNPLATGDISVRIYDAPTSGSLIYDSGTDFNGAITDGIYDVLLNPNLDNTKKYYMEIDINGEEVVGDATSGREAFWPGSGDHTHAHIWSQMQDIPADIADGDNDTVYSAGTGLTLAGTLFSIDPTLVQQRVTGSCPAGSSIRIIDQNGMVTCETDEDTVLWSQSGSDIYYNGRYVGLGLPNPGEKLHIADGHILIEGGGETQLMFKRDVTYTGGPSGTSQNPIFKFGRIIQAGDGDPEVRVLYSDDSTSERTVFEFDRKGIVASVKPDVGSHFEGFISGDSEPRFRLNSYPNMQLEMGPGGSVKTDVAIRRSGTNLLSFITGPTDATAKERMVIDGIGRVGIGIINPSSELEVVGYIETDGLKDRDGTNFFDGSCTSTQTLSGISSGGQITCKAINFLSGIVCSDCDSRFVNTAGDTMTGNLNIDGFDLDVNGNARAKKFQDRDNTGYYIDPASTSVMNTVATTDFGCSDCIQGSDVDESSLATVPSATALSANGANCVPGQYARGVDASGNAEGCTEDIDTNAHTICGFDQYLDGSGVCRAAATIVSSGGGITAETDPQVATTTSGRVCYGTGSAVTCNDNLHWDSTNDRLGIGTVNPSAKLDVEVTSGGAATIGSSSNSATGDYAIAMGYYTTASGNYSTAMGTSTTASGRYSTAIGVQTTASGFLSTAMGDRTTASGDYSTAMGSRIEARGAHSVGIGLDDATPRTITQPNTMAIMGGKVGIGTTNPLSKLSVGGDGYSGTGVYGEGFNYGVYGKGNNYGVYGEGSYYGVYGYVYDSSGENTGVLAVAGSTGSNNAFAVYSRVDRDGSGNYYSGFFHDSGTGGTYNGLYADVRTGGAIDLAEYILDTNDNTEPGDVVIADPNNYESIIKSNKPYDTTVLGVISTEPHMVMGMELVMDKETGEMYEDVNAAQLSLAGRVPTKVTNENGNIEPGDLLTTSSTPGHAMKFELLKAEKGMTADELVDVINENEKRRNSILGKALEPCDKETCKIVALVTLQ